MIDATSRITYGVGTYGKPQVFWWGENARVIIGKYCSIDDSVKIFIGGEHRTDWITTYPFNIIRSSQFGYIKGHPHTKGDVLIGNDVWLGYDSVILSGSNIGSGAVIGARSVVSGTVGPYEIWAGNPARLIKYRFDSDIKEALLRIAWWDWTEEKIYRVIPLLQSSSITEFIKQADLLI